MVLVSKTITSQAALELLWNRYQVSLAAVFTVLVRPDDERWLHRMEQELAEMALVSTAFCATYIRTDLRTTMSSGH
jgi:hypothetical protein